MESTVNIQDGNQSNEIYIHALKYDTDESANHACFYVDEVPEKTNKLSSTENEKQFLWQSQKWHLTIYDENELAPYPKKPKSKRTFHRRLKDIDEGSTFQVSEIFSTIPAKENNKINRQLREFVWRPTDISVDESYILVTYTESDSDSIINQNTLARSISTSYASQSNHEDFEITYDENVDFLERSIMHEQPIGGLGRLTYISEKLLHVKQTTYSLADSNKETYEVSPINIRLQFQEPEIWVAPYEGNYGIETSHFQVSERFGDSLESSLLQITSRGGYLSDFSFSLSDVRRLKRFRKHDGFERRTYADLPSDVIVIDELKRTVNSPIPNNNKSHVSSSFNDIPEPINDDDDEDFEDLSVDFENFLNKNKEDNKNAIDVMSTPPSSKPNNPVASTPTLIHIKDEKLYHETSTFKSEPSNESIQNHKENEGSDRKNSNENIVLCDNVYVEEHSNVTKPVEGSLEFDKQSNIPTITIENDTKAPRNVTSLEIDTSHHNRPQSSEDKDNNYYQSDNRKDAIYQSQSSADVTDSGYDEADSPIQQQNKSSYDAFHSDDSDLDENVTPNTPLYIQQEPDNEEVLLPPTNKPIKKPKDNALVNSTMPVNDVVFVPYIVDPNQKYIHQKAHKCRDNTHIINEQEIIPSEKSLSVDSVDLDNLDRSFTKEDNVIPDELADFKTFQCNGITRCKENFSQIVDDERILPQSEKRSFKPVNNASTSYEIFPLTTEFVNTNYCRRERKLKSIETNSTNIIVEDDIVASDKTLEVESVDYSFLDKMDDGTSVAASLDASNIVEIPFPDELSELTIFKSDKDEKEKLLIVDHIQENVLQKPIAIKQTHKSATKEEDLTSVNVVQSVSTQSIECSLMESDQNVKNIDQPIQLPGTQISEEEIPSTEKAAPVQLDLACLEYQENEESDKDEKEKLLIVDHIQENVLPKPIAIKQIHKSVTKEEDLSSVNVVKSVSTQSIECSLMESDQNVKNIDQPIQRPETQISEEEIPSTEKAAPVQLDLACLEYQENEENQNKINEEEKITPEPIDKNLQAQETENVEKEVSIIVSPVEEKHVSHPPKTESDFGYVYHDYINPHQISLQSPDDRQTITETATSPIFRRKILSDDTTAEDSSDDRDLHLSYDATPVTETVDEAVHYKPEDNLDSDQDDLPKTELPGPSYSVTPVIINEVVAPKLHESATLQQDEVSKSSVHSISIGNNQEEEKEIQKNRSSIKMKLRSTKSFDDIEDVKDFNNDDTYNDERTMTTTASASSIDVNVDEQVKNGKKKSIASKAKKFVLKKLNRSQTDNIKATEHDQNDSNESKTKKSRKSSFKKLSMKIRSKPKSLDQSTDNNKVDTTSPRKGFIGIQKLKYDNDDTTSAMTVSERLKQLNEKNNSNEDLLGDDNKHSNPRASMKRSNSFDSFLNFGGLSKREGTKNRTEDPESRERRRRLAGYSYMSHADLPRDLGIIKGRDYSIEACARENEKEIDFIRKERKKQLGQDKSKSLDFSRQNFGETKERELDHIRKERRNRLSKYSNSMDVTLDVITKLQDINAVEIPEIFLNGDETPSSRRKYLAVGKIIIPVAFSVDDLTTDNETNKTYFKVTDEMIL